MERADLEEFIQGLRELWVDKEIRYIERIGAPMGPAMHIGTTKTLLDPIPDIMYSEVLLEGRCMFRGMWTLSKGEDPEICWRVLRNRTVVNMMSYGLSKSKEILDDPNLITVV